MTLIVQLFKQTTLKNDGMTVQCTLDYPVCGSSVRDCKLPMRNDEGDVAPTARTKLTDCLRKQ